VARSLTRRHHRSRQHAGERSIAALYELARAISARTVAAGADHLLRAAARSAQRGTGHGRKGKKPRRLRIADRSLVNMTTEQRLDYLAACDGKITWARYHAKWGPSL
jgi:hypothetical protein